MNVTNTTCHNFPDPYIITTSLYYVILGFLGVLLNNSYVHSINSLIFVTGITYIVQYTGYVKDFVHIPTILCIGEILFKYVAELLKHISRTKSEKDIENGKKYKTENNKRRYRLPTSIFSLLVRGCEVFVIKFYSLYILIAFIAITQVIAIAVTLIFFPSGENHHSVSRSMLFRIIITGILSCIGLGTSNICPDKTWVWLRLFIGVPISNFSLAYCLYTSAQLLILIRSKNLRRRVGVKGTSYIYVAYYIGRFAVHSD